MRRAPVTPARKALSIASAVASDSRTAALGAPLRREE
jgi:hypothetical protein